MGRTLQEVVGLLCIDAILCAHTILGSQEYHYKGKVQQKVTERKREPYMRVCFYVGEVVGTEAKETGWSFEMKMVELLCIDAIARLPFLVCKATIPNLSTRGRR